jgi:hypothetical protein
VELSANHSHNFNQAVRLIHLAKDAGADVLRSTKDLRNLRFPYLNTFADINEHLLAGPSKNDVEMGTIFSISTSIKLRESAWIDK